MSEKEYLRLESLVDEMEWIASLQYRAAALPELPLDLDPFLAFLDVKVGGFIAPPSRGISLGSMTSKTFDKVFTNVHIRRLQRLRVAQQDAFEEAEFLHSVKTVDETLEAEFLYALRKADEILEHQKEHYTTYLAQEDNMTLWLEVQFTADLYEADLRLGMRPNMALLWSVNSECPLEAAGTIVVLEGW